MFKAILPEREESATKAEITWMEQAKSPEGEVSKTIRRLISTINEICD